MKWSLYEICHTKTANNVLKKYVIMHLQHNCGLQKPKLKKKTRLTDFNL